MTAVDKAGVVYRCFDSNDRLIYVGSTSNVSARLNVHRRQSDFYDRIAEVRHSQWHPLADARRIESGLIRSLRPLLNRHENPDFDGLSVADARALFRARLATVPLATDRPEVIDETPEWVREQGRRRAAEAMSRVLAQILEGVAR